LQIRIGLHTGMAGASGDDYIASTVDKTARVQSQTAAGQVFISHQTQVLVSERMRGVEFQPRGIFDLKGLQSEELYQAVALPSLNLPPVNLDSAENVNYLSAKGKLNFRSKSSIWRLLVPIALCGVLIVGGGFAWKNAQQKNVVFPVGSEWDGSFHFLPPMASYDGSVSIDVTERSGDNFVAIYSTENDAYQWRIEGTVKGQSLRWDFIKAIKNPGTEDAVGKAYCEATIDGKQMKGFFRMNTDMNEVATLDLRATK